MKISSIFLCIAFGILGIAPSMLWSQKREEVFSIYLGGNGHNQPIATAVINNNLVAVAGNFDQVQDLYSNAQTVNFFSGTPASKGRVLFVNVPNGDYQTIYNFGNEIYDMEFVNGFLYVAGDFGIAKINTSTNLAVYSWRAPRTGRIKLSAGNSGNCAALINKEIFYFDDIGVVSGSYNVLHNYCNDIVLHGSQIIVGGYDSKINSGYAPCSMEAGYSYDIVDVAFVDVLNYVPNSGGAYKNVNIKYSYSIYNFESNTLACDMDGTQVNRLAMGTDGFLYLLGTTNGPKNIFRWNGKTTWKLNGGSNPSKVYDAYYNDYHDVETFTSGNPAQFVGKVSLTDKVVVKGFFTRTISPITNTQDYIDSENGALALDPFGSVHVGSMSGNATPRRASSQVFQTQPAPYAEGDPTLMSLQGMNNTKSWETFTGAGGMGSIVSIDFGDNAFSGFIQASVGELYAGNAIVSQGRATAYSPSATDNASDAFLVVHSYTTMVTASDRFAEDSLLPKVTENCECIMVKSKEQHYQYQVFDMRGLLISQEKCEGESLRVDKTLMEQGVYILKVYTKTSAFTHKFNVY